MCGVVLGILCISLPLFAFSFHLNVSAIISIPICHFSCSTHSLTHSLAAFVALSALELINTVCYANWTFNYQKRYKFCIAKEIIKCFWVQVVVVCAHHRCLRQRHRHHHIIFSAWNVYSIVVYGSFPLYSYIYSVHACFLFHLLISLFSSLTCRQFYTHAHAHKVTQSTHDEPEWLFCCTTQPLEKWGVLMWRKCDRPLWVNSNSMFFGHE